MDNAGAALRGRPFLSQSFLRRNRHKLKNQHKPLALLLAFLLVTSTALGWTQTAAPASTRAITADEQKLVDNITIASLKETVNTLAADEMQGRGTGQPGGDKAAAYLADRFAKLGLKPLGINNTYLQPIKFRETQFLPQTAFTVGEQSLKFGTDYFVTPPLSGEKNVKAPMYFVGYGVSVPALNRDDFAGIDPRGKIVMVREGPLPGYTKEQWKKAGAQFNIFRGLIQRGVAGIVIIGQDQETITFSEIADYLTRRQIEPDGEQEMPEFLPPFISISEAAADKLFVAAGTSKAEAFKKCDVDGFKPIDLKQSAAITVKLKKAKGIGNNVVGLLEGSDPKLKEEAIVFSAHYDAYGLSADNRIYHGAADNALGVAEMLAIAEAMTKAEMKPRRSMIFLAVTGEEYGGDRKSVV